MKKYFDNRKKLILSLIYSVLLIFCGVTFGLWTWESLEENRSNVTFLIESFDGGYSCMANGGSDIVSNEAIIMPAPCTSSENVIMREIDTSVEVEKEGIQVKYELWLDVNSIGLPLTESTNFKYVVTTSSNSCTTGVVSSGNFNGKNSGSKVNIFNENYLSSETKKLYLYIWLDEGETNPNTANQNFNLSLGGNCTGSFVNVSDPVLDEGMIPVIISDDGVVTTIDEDDPNWYDYYNKKWANMVLVNENATSGIDGSKSREYYLNNPGTTVIESDILAYYVWIPRYKYKIWTTGVSSTGSEETIDIQFESINESLSLGTNVGEYRTHPAFWWDQDSDGIVDIGETISGIWVGKFETGGDATTPKIKPNVSSLMNQNVSTQFQTSLKFAGGVSNDSIVSFSGNNTYGLTSDIDSHMMKNSEWGAVAYLSHSRYGINGEVRVNNYYNSGTKTGCGASTENEAMSNLCGIVYGEAIQYPQSTTGNITGVYDMSGGAYEYVMGNYNNIIGNSGFGVFPNIKYYELYNGTDGTNSCNSGYCFSLALGETAGWYSDYDDFVDSSNPWFMRGSYFDGKEHAGLFSSEEYNGRSSDGFSWRSVLVPLDLVNVTFDANGGSFKLNVENGETVSYTTSGEFVYTIPNDGEYRLEVWGAQGGGGVISGSTTYDGGYGGYSIGNVSLEKNDLLYFNIGGQGTTSGNSSAVGGYNGGGSTQNNNYGGGRGSGGGATHIALDSGLLSTFQNKKDRLLIVAGGGGGGAYYNSSQLGHGGHAGGYIGNTGTGSNGTPGTGGTQDAGGTGTVTGTFGAGANAVKTYQNNSYGGPGGGGGYYGGGAAYNNSGGGGGSGYIANDLLTNKSMYCFGCLSSNDVNSLTYVTESVSEQPVSNYAKSGGGAAKITLLSSKVNTYSQNILYKSTYGELPIPEKNGSEFLGWYTETNGGEHVTEDTIVTLDFSHTLYAIWDSLPVYTISFDANGGAGVPDVSTKIYGETLILSSSVPTRDGYKFLGWSTSSSATSATYSAGGSYTANEGAILYAVWEINTWTVSYNANGGSGAPSSQTKTYGQTLTLSSTVPTRTGYEFLGWSTSESSSRVSYNAGAQYTNNASVTLYAVWRLYLYNSGNQNTSITGGWSQVDHSVTSYWSSGQVSFGSSITLTGSTTSSSTSRFAGIYTVNKINLAGYQKLFINVTRKTFSGTANYSNIIISSRREFDDSSVGVQSVNGLSQGLIEVNVSSLNGSYYIGVTASGEANSSASITFDKIYLE